MVEKMLEESEELLDTPYLRRIRQQGIEEGIAKDMAALDLRLAQESAS